MSDLIDYLRQLEAENQQLKDDMEKAAYTYGTTLSTYETERRTAVEEMQRYQAENVRLRAALAESYRQIRLLAAAGVERLTDHGVKVDPAERTYEPIIDRIKALCTLSDVVSN
jgi:uncharacterized protein involved in type VI secretion and phage assembly